MMRWWVTWVVHHPWRVIAVVLTITVGFAVTARNTRSEIEVGRLLPQQHPYVRIHNKIEREFGGRSLVIFALVPKTGDVWQPAVLATVKAVTDDLLRVPGVISQNVTSLSAPAVRTFADRGGRIEVEYLMREVPTSSEAIGELRRRVDDFALFRGLLVADDQRAALVLADFWPDRDEHEIARAIESIAKRHANEQLDVYWVGTPIVMDEISREVLRTHLKFAIAFVGIAVILYASFRSIQGMILPLATGVIALLWGVGLMAALGIVIDAWTVMTPILILSVAAGHSAQILKRYYEEYERGASNHEAVIESTSRIGLVMLAAGSTASLGFLSLLVFRVPSLQNFAIFTGWGIAAAMILELSFIPACRALMTAPERAVKRAPRAYALGRILDVLANATTRRRARWVLVFWCVVVAVAVAGAFRIRATASLETFIPPGSQIRRNLDAVREHFRGAMPMVIEIEGDEGAIQTPEVIRYISELAEHVGRQPTVMKALSVADVLTYVNGILGPDGRATLPNEPALISQLLFLTYSAPYERFLDPGYRRSAIWAYLRTDDTASIDAAIQHAHRFVEAKPPPSSVRVLVAGGMGPAVVAINDETTHGKVWNVALIYLVIFAIGSLLFRSVVAGALILLPLAVAFAANLGVLGWGRIDLDLTTSTILAIGVGIGADYAIYLLSRIKEEVAGGFGFEESIRRALLTSGKAVWFVACAVGGGYVLLSPFSFLPLRLFGILIPITMLVACASAVTLIPAILSLRRPAFLRSRNAPDESLIENGAETPRKEAVR